MVPPRAVPEAGREARLCQVRSLLVGEGLGEGVQARSPDPQGAKAGWHRQSIRLRTVVERAGAREGYRPYRKESLMEAKGGMEQARRMGLWCLGLGTMRLSCLVDFSFLCKSCGVFSYSV